MANYFTRTIMMATKFGRIERESDDEIEWERKTDAI